MFSWEIYEFSGFHLTVVIRDSRRSFEISRQKDKFSRRHLKRISQTLIFQKQPPEGVL